MRLTFESLHNSVNRHSREVSNAVIELCLI